MTVMDWLGALLSLAMLGYLIFAMLFPEKF